MDDRDSDPLKFRGQDATECEDFITAVLKCAFAEGKQRDDQWMADFAATCMTNDALRWWSALDEEVRGSWKLLRPAMLSKYRPVFFGGSGKEAEMFIRAVRDKAIDEGKRKDNEWLVAYAESCLAGEALRWYTYLDADTQDNWKKLQQALLLQYPRDGTASPALNLVPSPPAAASLAPAPTTVRRGRIRVSNSGCSTLHYLSKCLQSGGRLNSTSSLADALELEWNTSPDGLQTLSIAESQIPGYDLLGVKWSSQDANSTRFLAFGAVNSQTNSTTLSQFTGALLTKSWKISATQRRTSDGILAIFVMDGTETLYPRCNLPGGGVWFSSEATYKSCSAELFFETV